MRIFYLLSILPFIGGFTIHSSVSPQPFTFTPLNIYNGTPGGRLNRDLRATLPINELKGNPPSEGCPILNLHRCKNPSMYDKNDNIQMLSNPIQKTRGFLKLIRYKNILPTLLLTTTGGFLQTQSITQLLKSKSFLASSMITVCIMASSMILNDLFDIHVDKINNANRPLVTGEVHPQEAVTYAALLLLFAECLTRYLPQQMQMVANWAIVNIVLYTPLLKRIPLVKNLSCATIVAFSLYFAGKSATSAVATSPLLYVAAHTVFFGSLHNELLLDIRDIEGDAKNHIRTVPGLFGKTAAWSLAAIGMVYNVVKISTALSVQYSPAPFVVAMSPIFYHLYQIRRHNYSSAVIKKAVDFTNVPLLLSLLYFCKISFS